MKYELMLRSRARKSEPIAEKHSRFFTEFSNIPAPWGIGENLIPVQPDPGRNLGAGINITKLLGKGISGRVYYVLRRNFEDLGMHDDFFDMSFNPKNVDFRSFVYDALPRLILAFDAYLARVGDVEFCYLDFDGERDAGLGDPRFGGYRIFPISFFDKTLCERAFGMNPNEIAERLQGRVECVKLLKDGIYIIGDSRPLKIEESDKLCWEIRRIITGNSSFTST